MTAREIHPVADLFPMLADDELAELAEDIKQRGLLQPIVLDPEGRVLDGRNRLAACEMAGVEPEFTTYDGDDPDGYAWSVNIRRRSTTKSQDALMAVRRFAGKNLPTREIATEAGVSHPLIVWAQAVSRYADLSAKVMSKTAALHDVYPEAQKRDAAEGERQSKIERLRDGAPDLLAVVEEQRISLDVAIAELDSRQEKARHEAEEAARLEQERASEEERQRRQREQERQESLERHRDRIRLVASGWPTLREVILPDPDSELAAEIIGGLGEPDREALARIIDEIGKARANG